MKRISMSDFLVGIEVKPALTIMLFVAGIPGNGEALHATVREGNQVLLQRVNPKRVGKIEVLWLAVGAVTSNIKLAVFLEEAGSHAVFCEVRIVEISQHGRIIGHLHRLGVMRSLPRLGLLRMALCAAFLANIGSG